VALAAITASERRQGKVFVRLSNGERVPVTRTYAPKLEAAGLIPPRSEVEE
jgi:DNA-binding LytR/AlgR family response regulator